MKAAAIVQTLISRRLILLTIALLMAGCARTSPVTYYQLTAIDADRPAAIASAIGDLVIGIGPVRLPELLDRPQIVIRTGSNRLQLAEGRRWAESLSENITRVLRENLAARLATERIVYYPWSRAAAVDYQIVIEILRFEGEGYNEAHLEAIWSIQGRNGKILLPQRRVKYRVESATPDFEGLVQALSGTLSQLCREIAHQLTQKYGNLPSTDKVPVKSVTQCISLTRPKPGDIISNMLSP